jgi:hypothetical protein
MPELRSNTTFPALIAALGIGFLAGSTVTAGSGCKIPHAPEGLSQPAIVQLPTKSNVQTFQAFPKPTDTPRLNEVNDPPRISDDSIEAMPTEDPYAG